MKLSRKIPVRMWLDNNGSTIIFWSCVDTKDISLHDEAVLLGISYIPVHTDNASVVNARTVQLKETDRKYLRGGIL